MRLQGKHGKLLYGGIVIADIYEVSVEINAGVEEASAWGDDWDVNLPERGNWRITARKYAVIANLGYFLTQVAQTPTAQIPVTVVVYQNTADPSTRVFEGGGWVTKGDISLPKGKIEETLEVTGTGPPVYVA